MGWPGGKSMIRCTRLILEIGLSLYISREKGDHYYIQTRNKDIFSHDNLILNAPKGARNTKRTVLMPPGHSIILLKSNFNAAERSVKRSFISIIPRVYSISLANRVCTARG